MIISALSYFAFVRVFLISKEPFSGPDLSMNKETISDGKDAAGSGLSKDEIKVAVLTTILIALWISEPLHTISAAWCAAAVVAALFAVRILRIKDFGEINLSLILFLTAAFSIGKVLAVNGIAQRMNEQLFRILPDSGSFLFFPVISILVMTLHLILGSCVTTLSLVVPSLVGALEGTMPAVLAAFIAYSIVNMQYLLPIHQVTIMIGAGKGYYSQKETILFGLVQSAIVLVAISCILGPWWTLTKAF